MSYEEEQGDFTEDIPSREDQSFEEISDRLKTFAKFMKENENFSLKGKTLMGGWLSTAARIFCQASLMIGFIKSAVRRNKQSITIKTFTS